MCCFFSFSVHYMKDIYTKIRSKLVLNFAVRCNRPLHYLKYQHLLSEVINLPVTSLRGQKSERRSLYYAIIYEVCKIQAT